MKQLELNLITPAPKAHKEQAPVQSQLSFYPSSPIKLPAIIPAEEKNASTFIFGDKSRHNGKSIEQVAMNDYDYLHWITVDPHFGKDVVKRAQEVRHKLNNFIPVVKCQCPNCNKIAEYMTVALTTGTQYNPHLDQNVTGVTDISASPRFVWCNEHKNSHDYRKATPYEIKADSIYEIERSTPYSLPKWAKNEIIDTVTACAGIGMFKERLSKKDLVDFIEVHLNTED